MYYGLTFETPGDERFEEVKRFIGEFRLDDRDLQAWQFITISDKDRLLAFGRLKDHGNCLELCSLGVIEPERRKGLGTGVTMNLIERADKDVYVVCIIPEFFKRCNFEIAEEYPLSIKEKLDYCMTSLSVPENYVVMKLKK